MSRTDWVGVATLISVTGGVLMNFAVFLYKIYTDRDRDKKLDVMHDLVNGQSEKLNAVIDSAAFARGVKSEREKQ